MTQFGESRRDGEAKPYADAFGEDSIFGRKIPVIGTNGEQDELSSEPRANAAAAEGLRSWKFGSKKER